MKRSFLGWLILILLAGCGPTHQGTTSTTGQADSGIGGTAVLWPTCPVQHVGQPPCERPVATTVDIDGPDGHRVATARSDSAGHFRVALAPGTYSLTAEKAPNGAGMFSKPVTVVVAHGTWVEVAITLDTGIRN